MINKNSPVFKAISFMPNPLDAERDYIECQILDAIFADASLCDKLVFSGGATLAKSYNLCHRISRDLDLSCTGFTDLPTDRSRGQLKKFKNRFKEFVFDQLRADMHYAINQDRRLMIVTDRDWRVLHNPEQRFSYPALHVLYQSILNNSLNYICIEIIPRKYNASAITYHSASPYSLTMPTREIPTVAYEQTFWDKVFALHSVADGSASPDSEFYSRHYFDVAQLSDKINIGDTFHLFNDTITYQTTHTTKKIAPIISTADICLIPPASTLVKLGSDYNAQRNQFLQTPPEWDAIVKKLQALKTRLNNLDQPR